MAPSDTKGVFADPPAEPLQDASRYRQTIPISAEEDDDVQLINPVHPVQHQQELPPPYAPRELQQCTDAQQNESHQSHPADTEPMQVQGVSRVDSTGYQSSGPMNWEQKERDGHWDKSDNDSGCCFSARGGCCFSDRDGCCFSDRDGCCFSDRDGCCFSDTDGCCFAENDGCCFSGGSVFRRKLIPSMGALC
eukprot:NODE_867_length_739_cov_809.826087_g666_i0.p1 GENE.NODE_867_length_739_cov_809.826087_g666_i0~~NODE_867_length_739_cov_809.826087_g666_i0.p1  ORF type:complete len:192 (-),score=20.10 NODE_867_length_739_cov_809.826087_g666_i0:81-656(-)